jgi:type II secretory pathway component PulM
VALDLTNFIVMAVLVGAGCGLVYVGLWFMLRTAGSERQQTTDLQLNALAAEVEALKARVVELGKAPAAFTVPPTRVQATVALGSRVWLRPGQVLQHQPAEP